MTAKETNPKDSVGIKKPPLSTVSGAVLMEVGVAMLEGARKYGRHNWRQSSVLASVYYDATMRHMIAWWEGQDIDTDSGISHITKAIASLMVLRDAMMIDNFNDDRPPKLNSEWMDILTAKAVKIIEKHPDPKKAITHDGV